MFHWTVEVFNAENPRLKSKYEIEVKVAFINVEIWHYNWCFLWTYSLRKQFDKEEDYELNGIPHREYEQNLGEG